MNVVVTNENAVNFHIIGAEMQIVNVELKPGDSK